MMDALGSVIGAVGNYITAKETSDANQAINKKNIAWQAQSQVQNQGWQEHMRATAYQATMADMRAAGLNPMLAFSKGPTSWGSASAAPGSSLGAVAPDIAGGLERGVRAVTTARAAPLERTVLEQTAREIASRADYNEANANYVRTQERLAPQLAASTIGLQGIQGMLGTQQHGFGERGGPSGPFWNPQVWDNLWQRFIGRHGQSAHEASRGALPAPGTNPSLHGPGAFGGGGHEWLNIPSTGRQEKRRR